MTNYVHHALLKPVRGWGIVAIVLVAAVCVLRVAVASTVWSGYYLLDRYRDGDPTVTIADLRDADARIGALGWGAFAALVLAAIAVIVWLGRARSNAEVLSEGAHRLGRGWVVGAWICPVVNLWFPYQVVSDVVKASDPRTPVNQDLRDVPGNGLVRAWWGAMAAGWLVAVFTALVIGTPKTIDAFRGLALGHSITATFLATAGVLFGLIVWRLSGWQDDRRETGSHDRAISG